MNKYIVAVVAFFFGYLVSYADVFDQQGETYLYSGRQAKQLTGIPVNIASLGSSSTSNDVNGAFTLRFNNARPGDIVSSLNISIQKKGYVWFNREAATQWILTSQRTLPIEICEASLIENLASSYSNSYVNWLKKRYEQSRQALRSQISDNEELKTMLNNLEAKYRKDIEDIKLRSVEFAYVDETALDTLEYAMRLCEVSGDIDKAIEIGNKINFSESLNDVGENLRKSHSRVLSDVSALYRTVNATTAHIKNLEIVEADRDTIKALYETVLPYYKQLLHIYSPDNNEGLRCSEEFYTRLKQKYGDLLYNFHRSSYCPPPCEFLNEENCEILKEAARLDNYAALYELYSLCYPDNAPESERLNRRLLELLSKEGKYRIYDEISELKAIGDVNLANIYEDLERFPSFGLKLKGDSAYFKILEPGRVSLVKWIQNDTTKRKITVPEKVKFEGKEYTVVKIGCEALGAVFYGDEEWSERINKLFAIEEIILPNTIEHISTGAIGSRFWDPQFNIPKNIRLINHRAFGIGGVKRKQGTIEFPEGLVYLGDVYGAEDTLAISLPKTVRYINCMKGCSKYNTINVSKITVSPDNPYFTAIDDVLYSKNKDVIYLGTLSGKKSWTIPAELNLTAEDISDFLTDSYYGHFALVEIETINLDEKSPYLKFEDGVLTNKIKGEILFVLGDTIRISPEIKSVSEMVFYARDGVAVIVDDASAPADIANVLNNIPFEYSSFTLHIYGHKVDCTKESVKAVFEDMVQKYPDECRLKLIHSYLGQEEM